MRPISRGVGVDVNEPLAGRGDLEQRVALRGGLRHPPADKQNEVGRFDPRVKLWIDRETDLARKVRMLAVERAGARNEPATGSAKRSAKRAKSALALLVHPAPPRMAMGRSAAQQHLLRFGHLRGARPDWDSLDAGGVGDCGHLGQHVLGQRDDDWPGSSLHGDVKGALHDLRVSASALSISVAHLAVEPKKAR